MSPIARLSHRAAFILLLLAVASMGLGVWGQIQQNHLNQARADAVVIDGAGAFNDVPVPLILRPFENDHIPALVKGDQITVFGVFARIGGAFGLLGLLLVSLRNRATAPTLVVNDLDDDQEPPSMAQVQSAPMAAWQQKLALRMAAQAQPTVATTTAASRFPARRALHLAAFGIVGVAFVTLGVSLIWGSSATPVAVPTSADIAGLADRTIMGLRRALAGDKAALLVVVQIVAVITGILMMAKIILSRRKPAARRGRARDRFATLG